MKSESIVDWDRDAPQWPALCRKAHDGGPKEGAASPDSLLRRIYGPLVQRNASGDSFVIGQMGQSLDGRTATASGQSHYINGPAAILHLHRLRALADAVVIGVGTALADDPQLTVRHVTRHAPESQPARVVIDPSGRLPPAARCLAPDGARRVVVGTDGGSRAALPAGVEHVRLDGADGGFAPRDIVTALRALGFARLLVEGGGRTVSRFLEAGCLHRLHVMVAPMVIGDGPVGLSFGESADLKDAVRPRAAAYALPGGDVLFDCAMEAP